MASPAFQNPHQLFEPERIDRLIIIDERNPMGATVLRYGEGSIAGEGDASPVFLAVINRERCSEGIPADDLHRAAKLVIVYDDHTYINVP